MAWGLARAARGVAARACGRQVGPRGRGWGGLAGLHGQAVGVRGPSLPALGRLAWFPVWREPAAMVPGPWAWRRGRGRSCRPPRGGCLAPCSCRMCTASLPRGSRWLGQSQPRLRCRPGAHEGLDGRAALQATPPLRPRPRGAATSGAAPASGPGGPAGRPGSSLPGLSSAPSALGHLTARELTPYRASARAPPPASGQARLGSRSGAAAP